MKNYVAIILVFLFIGCKYSTIEPEPAPKTNCWHLIINGVKELFCGDVASGVYSQLQTTDSLYIYNEANTKFKNSENYKASLVSFANYIPDSTEFKFFYDLIGLLSPESYHDLDIRKPGGFAIEVWDMSGEYYSTELGPQTKGGQIFIRSTTTYMAGPVYNQVIPYMTISFENRQPIILWNADNTRNLEVGVSRVNYFIQYPY
jgi:hypothetical protein